MTEEQLHKKNKTMMAPSRLVAGFLHHSYRAVTVYVTGNMLLLRQARMFPL